MNMQKLSQTIKPSEFMRFVSLSLWLVYIICVCVDFYVIWKWIGTVIACKEDFSQFILNNCSTKCFEKKKYFRKFIYQQGISDNSWAHTHRRLNYT